MKKAYRNPLAATDPYAVPWLSGNNWYDFGFGPVCRRLLAKYGVPLPTGHREQAAPGPGARQAVGVDATESGMLPFEAFGPDRRSA